MSTGAGALRHFLGKPIERHNFKSNLWLPGQPYQNTSPPKKKVLLFLRRGGDILKKIFRKISDSTNTTNKIRIKSAPYLH